MEDYLLRHVTVRRRLGYMWKAAKAPCIRAKSVHIHIPMADSVPESDVELIVIDESGKKRSGHRLEDTIFLWD